MQHHPIPQNVTNYQFRLIGPMTIKQFGELAAGLLLAFFSYNFPLPFFIKYPLVLLFGLGGAALAFLPIEGLPLDRWLIAFFRSIYTPTLFIWQKDNQKNSTPSLPSSYADSDKTPKLISKLDQIEINLLNRFQHLTHPQAKTPTPTPPSPTPIPSPQPKTPPTPTPTTPVSSPPSPPSSPPIEPQIVFERGLGTTTKFVKQLHQSQAAPSKPPVKSTIHLPEKPDRPNLLLCIVIDQQNHLVDNAMIEIIQADTHVPIRILKTDSLGKFFTTTPLENGRYQLKVEKAELNFDIVKIELKGEIFDPIEIKAKN